MAPERWIVIPRWDDFQHRDAARSNVPTWMKTFTRLLSDDDYLSLTPNRRAILHGLWLEYARSLRQLPENTASLSRRLAMKVTSRDLEALNHAGWIHFSASKPASNLAGEHASTEEKREEKRREEQDLKPDQDPASLLLARPPAPESVHATNGRGTLAALDYATVVGQAGIHESADDPDLPIDWSSR